MMQLVTCIVQSMAATTNPLQDDHPIAGRAAAVAHLEPQLAVLARRLEHTSRRSATFRRLGRAGCLLARTIEAGGPLTVNRLAQTLGLDGSTVTRQVAALADRGFVNRRPDPDDGRAIVVSLSPAGRREMEA